MNTYDVILVEDGDDLILPFPQELLDTMKWKEGDSLVWIDNQDGSWTIKKDDTI